MVWENNFIEREGKLDTPYSNSFGQCSIAGLSLFSRERPTSNIELLNFVDDM